MVIRIWKKIPASYMAAIPPSGAKLSDNEVAEIRTRYAVSDVTQQQLAEEYNITQGYVSMLCRGLSRGDRSSATRRHPDAKTAAGWPSPREETTPRLRSRTPASERGLVVPHAVS